MTHFNNKMPIGADYYPEHWPRERWETDAKLMKEAGFNVTRLAEFSWAKLEPREGHFDFGWLDDSIELLGRYGIKVLLCTPTPTVPKWLYDKYPETILEDEKGHQRPFGNRQNNCFSSHTLRVLSRRITTALAEHYKGNPNVIGWQLDNELNGPNCYCKRCDNAFKDWLENKYQDINKLNSAWGTIFWSQTYRGFHELHVPHNKHSSPSIYLDWRRFHSQNVVSFAKEQADILRTICPTHFVTHNMMGFGPTGVNYYDLGEMLDFISDDYYYTYGETRFEDRQTQYRWGAGHLDFSRGVKNKPFWIMENSAGTLGWETYSRNLRPGEMRRMTFQNMAHGACAQIWFRWRTCIYGTEQYWHGILDHSGIPGRRYKDVVNMTPEMQKVYAAIEGGKIESQVAIYTDYEDRWALHHQPNVEGFSYSMAMDPYHTALYKAGVNVDFIKPGDDFSHYKMVLLPYKYLLEEPLAKTLSEYVKQGGTLIITCRCGVKNEVNVCHEMVLPGYLREAAGVRVEEYEGIAEYEIDYKGSKHKVNQLADWVIPEGAKTLGAYTDPGLPYSVITANNYGKGQVWYIGSIPSYELAEEFMKDAMAEAKVSTHDLPENVELVVHTKGDKKYGFLLNHNEYEVTVNLPKVKGTDLLSDSTIDGAATLKAGDAAVIEYGI